MRTTEALEVRARTQPDRVIFRQNDTELTYRDWLTRSTRAAEALVGQGVGRGDRVAIAYRADRWFDYAGAWLACQMAAAIPVGIPEHLSASAIRGVVTDSGAQSVVGDRDLVSGMRRISLDGDSARPGHLHDIQGTEEDIAELAVSSGTTGANKLVACSHANLMADAVEVDARDVFGDRTVEHLSRPVMGTNAAQRAIINALRGTWYCFNILPTADASDVVRQLRDRPIEEISLVPVIAAALVRDWRHSRYPAVTKVRMGTAATPEWVVRGLERIFPKAELANNYGFTEGGHFQISGRFHQGRPGPMRVLHHGRVRVVKDDGDDAADGEVGVLWVQADTRSPRLYYVRGELLPIADQQGWIRTHDLAKAVGPGELVLMGRSSEIANVGGVKVSLPLMEEAVGEIRGVRDCGAFVLPHQTQGELVGVAIVVDPAAADDVEAAKFAVSRALGSGAPRLWLRVEHIPRTATGKIQRSELTEMIRRKYGY